MADNIELDAGSGGATVAADDVGGVHYQVIKLDVGADGVAAPLSNSNPVPVSDAGGTLTVDGTVAVTNAGLTELAAAINGSSQMDVNIAASNATVAVSNAGLTALNGAISGTEVQVDVLTMPTVTVNAHAVTNAGTFAVQVDGSALTSLQLLDDAVYVDDADWTDDTSKHVLVGGVYQSTQHTVTDGDVSPLAVDANGNLRVAIASGGVAGILEDAASAGGEEGIMMLAVRRDAASSGVSADGDFAALSVTSDGSLRVSGSSGTTQYAEDDASAGAESLCLVGTVRRDSAAVGSGTDGDYSTLNVDSTGRLWCNVSNTVTVASHAVTNAGTFAVQNTAQASTNTQEMVGDAADDAATAGNPVLIGGVAVETDGTDPTTVSAEGDAAYLRTDRARRLLVSQHHPRGWFVSADYGSAQTNTSVKAAPGAGLKLYVTDVVISNGATAGNVTLLDGSGGTVLFEIYPAINGGISFSPKTPIVLTANTALCITSTTVTTHSVNIGGYIAP